MDEDAKAPSQVGLLSYRGQPNTEANLMSILTYNGQAIEQRNSNNYVNLTQMAKANDVELKHFNDSEFAKNYLKALQESISRDSRLMIVEGFGAKKVTWGHPLVAIAFGQWISPPFHVWCNQHILVSMRLGTIKSEEPVVLTQTQTRTQSQPLCRDAIAIKTLNPVLKCPRTGFNY